MGDDSMKFFRKIYYDIKYFIQRGKRGYSNFDLMDMDTYLLDLIPNMLKSFKEKKDGFPSDLDEDKWNCILDEIINCFEKANPSTTDFENPYLNIYYENVVDPWFNNILKPQMKNIEKEKQNFITLDMSTPEEYKDLENLYKNSEKDKKEYLQKNLEKGFELLLKYFHHLWY